MIRALNVKIGRKRLGKLRRVVLRLEVGTLERVTALMPRWPGAKRAAVLRALVLRGLDAAEFAEAQAQAARGAA